MPWGDHWSVATVTFSPPTQRTVPSWFSVLVQRTTSPIILWNLGKFTKDFGVIEVLNVLSLHFDFIKIGCDLHKWAKYLNLLLVPTWYLIARKITNRNFTCSIRIFFKWRNPDSFFQIKIKIQCVLVHPCIIYKWI
jgi:hypothetical protein